MDSKVSAKLINWFNESLTLLADGHQHEGFLADQAEQAALDGRVLFRSLVAARLSTNHPDQTDTSF